MASGLKQVDLDKLVDEFALFQKYTNDGHSRAELLEEQLEAVNKQVSSGQDREKQLQHDQEELQSIVCQLQGILSKRCDMEEENRRLCEELEEIKEAMKAAENLNKEKLTEMETNLEDQQTTHQVELLELKQILKQTAEEEEAKFEQALEEREQQIQDLQKQLADQETANQEDLTRLRQEYDAKFLKLQKQTTRAQQATQGTAANQDIFRKKLQHAKVESEREINRLHRTIQELQQKLSVGQAQKPPVHTALPKRRRL